MRQGRASLLPLALHPAPAPDCRLYRCSRARPSCYPEPYWGVLARGGTGDARLRAAEGVAFGTWRRVRDLTQGKVSSVSAEPIEATGASEGGVVNSEQSERTEQ